jgi:hypothetical protein
MEIKYLQVLVMPNDEILCEGKTVGYAKNLGKYLVDADKVMNEKKPASSEKFEVFNEETHYNRKTKTYEIEVSEDKTVAVKKWWIVDDIANDYEIDWEFSDEESKKWYDEQEEELQEEFSEFISELE